MNEFKMKIWMNHRVVFPSKRPRCLFLCNRLQLLCMARKEDICPCLCAQVEEQSLDWKKFPETRSPEHSWDYFIPLSPLSAENENFLKTDMFAYYSAGMDYCIGPTRISTKIKNEHFSDSFTSHIRYFLPKTRTQ